MQTLERTELGHYRSMDLRHIPPEERALHVFQAFEGINVGDDFVIVIEHEPVELRRQMKFELGNRVEWTVLEKGAGLWRILIKRRG